MSRSIQRVLIANRGEIARRIMRTCRRLGIGAVAIYSDADADMPFVREADEALRIGPAPSSQSYLCIDKIIEAAKRSGADAIHPGYGFLAENADFAEACRSASLVFIGPSAEAIRAMGSKREAKALVQKAGVPVIPGYDGADQDPKVLAEQAAALGFPALLKASAGGGGKGMKLVRFEGELTEAIESARREAQSAFGDGTLLVEKYIEDPRHVEIQILGDSQGNVIHLNERECSIQRRHQKIIEETPSPALDETLRAHMGEAALRCAQAIGYENAGTVEFILAPDRSFYFLEVNTRLQVEHPITECVTGLDLVEEQIHVAQGEPLRLSQDQVRLQGAAMEVRLYAEDPSQGFLPQSGKLVDWHIEPAEGLRVDSGVEAGTEVSIHYDPMLAKLVTHGDSREQAIQRMRRALASLSVQGLRTNRDFLLQVLGEEAFLAGEIHTHFIERHMGAALSTVPDEGLERHAAILAALADHERREAERSLVPCVPSGWRNNFHTPQWVEYRVGDRVYRVQYRHHGAGRFELVQADGTSEIRVLRWNAPYLTYIEDEHRRKARVVLEGDRSYVHADGKSVALQEHPRFPDTRQSVPEGGCTAPMPGKVVELRVAEGDDVEVGEVLLIMEAMKMEHSVATTTAGKVESIRVSVGDQVDADALLVVVRG